MDEYVSRAGIIAEYDRQHQGPPGGARKIMEAFPAADVVSLETFNRILAENDTMRTQLAQIGKKPGDRMGDVRPARFGEWTSPDGISTCSICGKAAPYDVEADIIMY